MAIPTPQIVDKKAVLAEIHRLQKMIDDLTPHANTAIRAFGDDAGNADRLNTLRNALAKAEAAYSA